MDNDGAPIIALATLYSLGVSLMGWSLSPSHPYASISFFAVAGAIIYPFIGYWWGRAAKNEMYNDTPTEKLGFWGKVKRLILWPQSFGYWNLRKKAWEYREFYGCTRLDLPTPKDYTLLEVGIKIPRESTSYERKMAFFWPVFMTLTTIGTLIRGILYLADPSLAPATTPLETAISSFRAIEREEIVASRKLIEGKRDRLGKDLTAKLGLQRDIVAFIQKNSQRPRLVQQAEALLATESSSAEKIKDDLARFEAATIEIEAYEHDCASRIEFFELCRRAGQYTEANTARDEVEATLEAVRALMHRLDSADTTILARNLDLPVDVVAEQVAESWDRNQVNTDRHIEHLLQEAGTPAESPNPHLHHKLTN